MVEIPLTSSLNSMKLNSGNLGHQRIKQTTLHRESHGDVDIQNFFRYRVQDRNEKILIRQHDGTIYQILGLTCAAKYRVKNIRKSLGLSYRGRHTDHVDIWYRQTFCIPLLSLLEFLYIFRQENRRTVLRITDHLTRIIPTELSLS